MVTLTRTERAAALYLLRSVNAELLAQLFDDGEKAIASTAITKIIINLEDSEEEDRL